MSDSVVSLFGADGPMADTTRTKMLDALTIVAHDLRGPLANLSIMLDVIEAIGADEGGDQVGNCVKRARTVVSSLDQVLNGVLERVRLTGDPLAYQAGIVDLRQLAENVADLNAPLAASRGTKIRLTGAPNVVVEGCSQLLTEAIDNLLNNAIRHAPAGGQIRLAVSRRDTTATIRVANDGSPLSGEDLRRAFNPFTGRSLDVDVPKRRRGLGLWITRLIAVRHGGQLVCQCEGGKIAFSLVLPWSLAGSRQRPASSHVRMREACVRNLDRSLVP